MSIRDFLHRTLTRGMRKGSRTSGGDGSRPPEGGQPGARRSRDRPPAAGVSWRDRSDSDTDDLWDQLTTLQTYVLAWERVRAARGYETAGVDGVRGSDFELVALHEIQELLEDVRHQVYIHSPLALRPLPASGKAPRVLGIPTIRDRVLQRALLDVLTPDLDPLFVDESHAYRPGRGVPTALAAIWRHLDEGCLHAVHLDIADCFDSIPHDLMLSALEVLLPYPRLLALLAEVVLAPVSTRGETWERDRGISQGGPLSPLLCNVHLHALDVGLVEHGQRFVRYGDDLLLLDRSMTSLEQAFDLARQLLGLLELRVNVDKVEVVDLTHPFTFLGTTVLPSVSTPGGLP